VNGDLLSVWRDLNGQVWSRLATIYRFDHPDLYCELYRSLNDYLVAPKSIEELADITDDLVQARKAFKSIKVSVIRDEWAAVQFLEGLYETLHDLGGQPMCDHYVRLLGSFLTRFNLRYELKAPCRLCPTLPGLFASHVKAVKAVAATTPHLRASLVEFEESMRDLRLDKSETRLKTCIQKQINLMEALGAAYPGVTANTLGAMAGEVGTWPHPAVKESLSKMYGFVSNYPGIRHAGNPASALRRLEMRDLVAVSVVLMGFTTYISNPYDGDRSYLEGHA
jgi:hypothetical protein